MLPISGICPHTKKSMRSIDFIQRYQRIQKDQRILQYDWLRAFKPVTPKKEFSQEWGLCRKIKINITYLKTI